MEIVTVVRKMLLGSDAVKGYVGDRIYKHRLEESVEGTGKRAIVVARGPNWRKVEFGGSEFPLVKVGCFADSSRDANGLVSVHDCEDSALAMARVVREVLVQLPAMVEVVSGSGLWLLGSSVWTGPQIKDTTGDWCVADVAFAMQTTQTAVVV